MTAQRPSIAELQAELASAADDRKREWWVRYLKGEGMGTIAVVMFREPRMGDGLGVNFPEYQFHLAEKEERCSPCHEMIPEEPEGGMAMNDFCTKCHDYANVDPTCWDCHLEPGGN